MMKLYVFVLQSVSTRALRHVLGPPAATDETSARRENTSGRKQIRFLSLHKECNVALLEVCFELYLPLTTRGLETAASRKQFLW